MNKQKSQAATVEDSTTIKADGGPRKSSPDAQTKGTMDSNVGISEGEGKQCSRSGA